MANGRASTSHLQDLSGAPVSVPDSGNRNVTLLYFFAPWCGVCKVSMPNLNDLKRNMPDVNIQAVALDYESQEDVKAFVKKHHIEVPVAYGNDELRRLWHVEAYPSYFVIDEDQTIRFRSVGYSSELGMILKIFWLRFFG